MKKDRQIVRFHIRPLDLLAETELECRARNGSSKELELERVPTRRHGVLHLWTCTKEYIRKLEAEQKALKEKGEKHIKFAVYGTAADGFAVNLCSYPGLYREDAKPLQAPIPKRRPKVS